MIKLPLVMSLVLLLSSCAKVVDHQGTQVDLYPVEYSVGFDLQDVSQKKATAQLDMFIDQYWSLIVSQPVQLKATTPSGYKLAQSTQLNLLKRGVEPENISLKQEQSITEHDFEMAILKHEVMVPECKYHSITNYDQGDDGCYIEGMRWLSITRPERMLVQKDTTISEQ